MTRLMKMLHDAWCGITGRCSTDVSPTEILEEDTYINWLVKEQKDSEHRIQEQAPNRIEVAYLYGQLNGTEAKEHG